MLIYCPFFVVFFSSIYCWLNNQKPELEINLSSVYITPETVDLSVDSIDVNVVVYNLGHATNDTFAIELTTVPRSVGNLPLLFEVQMQVGRHYKQ